MLYPVLNQDPLRPVVSSLFDRPRGASIGTRCCSALASRAVVNDVSDMSTLFQDAAGTTPVTVVSSPSGASDKSGRGNHATQATTTKGPQLSRRVPRAPWRLQRWRPKAAFTLAAAYRPGLSGAGFLTLSGTAMRADGSRIQSHAQLEFDAHGFQALRNPRILTSPPTPPSGLVGRVAHRLRRRPE